MREEVKSLNDQLEVSEERVSQLQEEEGIIKILEKNILKYSERVNGLL